MKSLSRARLLETPWTAAYQAPPSMGLSRQEYWSEVSLPSLDRFLEKFNLPRLNQNEIEIMNSPITSTEVETDQKSPKKPKPDGFTDEFYQTSRDELIPILLKFFQNIAEEGTLPNSFDEATITLIPKPKTKKNLQANITDEHRCKNTQQNSNKQIQQHIKKLIHHYQVGFIPGIQGFFNTSK